MTRFAMPSVTHQIQLTGKDRFAAGGQARAQRLTRGQRVLSSMQCIRTSTADDEVHDGRGEKVIPGLAGGTHHPECKPQRADKRQDHSQP